MDKNSVIKKLNKIFISVIAIVIVSAFLITGCSLFLGQSTTSQTTTSEASITTAPSTETEMTTAVVETTAQESTTVTTVIGRSPEIDNEFQSLEKVPGNIKNIFKFIDDNIADSDPELASEMIYAVLSLCEDYKFDFTEKFSDQDVQNTINQMAPSIEDLDLNILKNTDDQKVKAIIEETISKKYKLMSVEGFIMPLVDYSAYDIYRQYLTQEMNDYLDIKLDESERPAVLDAGIVIPIDDFIQRIEKSIKYLEDYTDSPRFEVVKNFNDGRIFVYLSGIDNNPVFDSNLKVIPSKLTEFESIEVKYSGTIFGDILASYLNLLKQENYARTQKVDDFLSNVSSLT